MWRKGFGSNADVYVIYCRRCIATLVLSYDLVLLTM